MNDLGIRPLLNAALRAGQEILRIYHAPEFGVTYKSDHSPLTLADSAAHQSIAKDLANTGIPLLSEEDSRTHAYAQRKDWTKCWIVDPLDGTKEFIQRNGEFAVNIALAEHGVPTQGVIYAPVPDVLYYAVKGKGAYRLENASRLLNNEDLVAQQLPLQALPQTCTIIGSRSHSSPETETYINQLREQVGEIDFIAAGSSLKFGLIAEGKAHAYPRFAPTMEWDTASGQIIVQESGGTMMDYATQKPMHYNREELRNGWFLVKAKGFEM